MKGRTFLIIRINRRILSVAALKLCTLQLLLGLPELLQLREILVQYEDFGETEGSHFRRSELNLVQEFSSPPETSL